MSVTFQDAIDAVRELTEAICEMLQDPDAGSGIVDMGIVAIEAGNRFLRDVGQAPVDEANLPGRDEEDEEEDEEDEEEDEESVTTDADGNVLLFVSISPEDPAHTMDFDRLENAARELLSQSGFSHGELTLEPSDQEDVGTGFTAHFAVDTRIWEQLEKHGEWELLGEGVRIEVEMP